MSARRRREACKRRLKSSKLQFTDVDGTVALVFPLSSKYKQPLELVYTTSLTVKNAVLFGIIVSRISYDSQLELVLLIAIYDIGI
jgi:hypothetical protein